MVENQVCFPMNHATTLDPTTASAASSGQPKDLVVPRTECGEAQPSWMQLVLLGVGWNFLFVSGTALLPRTYEERDKFKGQAINDLTVFTFQALASLSAGWALGLINWQQMLLICLLPIAIMLVLLLVEGKVSRNQSQSPR